MGNWFATHEGITHRVESVAAGLIANHLRNARQRRQNLHTIRDLAQGRMQRRAGARLFNDLPALSPRGLDLAPARAIGQDATLNPAGSVQAQPRFGPPRPCPTRKTSFERARDAAGFTVFRTSKLLTTSLRNSSKPVPWKTLTIN